MGGWCRMGRVEEVFRSRTYEELLDEINRLADSTQVEEEGLLDELLSVRDPEMFRKHATPRYVARLLVGKGPEGINRLVRALDREPGHINGIAILEAIFGASRRELGPLLTFDERDSRVRVPAVTDQAAQAARLAFTDLALRSLTDSYLQALIGSLVMSSAYTGHGIAGGLFPAIFEAVSEASIKVSDRLLQQLEALIGERKSEEAYQRFLSNNPVLLDPLASDVIAKQRLGSDFVTDFVIRRLDDQYLLVEIERPDSPMFNRRDDFTAEFTHAYGQILDFQTWVEENAAYARTILTGIAAPPGLLVIGLRRMLSDRQIKKLARLNITGRGTIQVLCFDDVLWNSRRLYENIRHRSTQQQESKNVVGA